MYNFRVNLLASIVAKDLSYREFERLFADIQTNGLLQPIILDVDGMLIDGRARLEICKRLGIAPKTRTYVGDIVSFLHMVNPRCQFLTDGQRAALASTYVNLEKGQTRALLDDVTQEDVARLFNVSSRSVRMAKAATTRAPELIHLMLSGKMAVREAERASRGED